MKELTIEQKAKRYDKAIERAKKAKEETESAVTAGILEEVFPELRESEDERIRKRLIDFFEDWHKNRSHCWGIAVTDILDWLEKQGEQKPTDEDMKEALHTEYEKGRADAFSQMQKEWSKEDEKCIRLSTDIIDSALRASFCVQLDRDRCVDWFNSIKDRLQPQTKQEWSEEDENICCTIINDITNDKSMCKYEISKGVCDVQINWLNSLKKRYTWTPSDEQMEALFVLLPKVSYGRNPAFSLYNDLKKLKEE